MSVFAFGVSRKRLEQAVRELGVPVNVARDLDEADAVVTLRNYYKRKPAALRDAESNGVPIYVLKTNTTLQMENMLASLFDLEADPQEAALRETAEAIGLVQALRPSRGAGAAERLRAPAAAPDGGAQRAHVPLARVGAEPARRAHSRRQASLAMSGRGGRIALVVIMGLVLLALVATSVLPPA